MKCIMRPVYKRDGTPDVEVVRVSDETASLRVSTGRWIYCNKELWKSKGRRYDRWKEKRDE